MSDNSLSKFDGLKGFLSSMETYNNTVNSERPLKLPSIENTNKVYTGYNKTEMK